MIKMVTFVSWDLRQICGASTCVCHRLSKLDDDTMLSDLSECQIREDVEHVKKHLRD